MKRFGWLLLTWPLLAAAWTGPVGEGAAPAPPWRFVGLPQQTLALTKFSVGEVDGRRALRVQADAGYGNLVHELPRVAAGRLQWSWRLDRALAAELERKEGDDASIKVCALFDPPLETLSLWDQFVMRMARSRSTLPVPAATLCYVWDPAQPAGRVIPNAYSDRLRWWVLQGRGAPLAAWRDESRDLGADYLRAFGGDTVPPLVGIAVGADADNTGGSSLAWVSGMERD